MTELERLQAENKDLKDEVGRLRDVLRDSNSWKAEYARRLVTLKEKLKELANG